MKALVYCGKHKVKVETVPDPQIINPRDAVIRVTTTCICGSDLHLYDGFMPTMKAGDILGHEFMGIVEETGPAIKNLKRGDRVVVPFTIACGSCFFCRRQLWSSCDNSNPNAWMAEKAMGFSPSGLFGYSHLTGGYAGGQAQFVRVPFADVGPYKIPDELSDDQVVFLTDIFPTGYMAAEHCNIQSGDTVAVWGCGPVGQFSIASSLFLGARQVVAIDDVPERLTMAARQGAVPLDFSKDPVYERLLDLTAGRGPDACIDAVGAEAHGFSPDAAMDRVKTSILLSTDRAAALRQAIICCRKGGTLSVPGVYVGFPDKLPFGALMNKGLTVKTGQTHVMRYLPHLTELIRTRKIDPRFVITHTLPLDQAPHGYEIFHKKQDGCIKVVLKP